jgi:tetratricopeptide (TPR) repeat protein
MDLGDLKKATYYFQQSLDVSKQNRDQGREAIILRNLGLVAAETKEYKVAEKYFLQSLELCKEIDFLDMELFNYEDLTELYNLTKNFEKAFQYHKIYTGKKDSLSDVESNRKSVESEMNYEFEKKQVAVEAERAIAERLKEEEANKQKMIRNVFIIGFCFVLVLAVFIFRGYKQKQKANIIISKQKEEVEKQKDVIEEQKLLVEEKNKEVMDSIRYAKRIQTALMSSEKSISNTIARLRKNKA